MTEGVGQGPGVMVDIGIGPHESDPSDPAWVWSSASYNEDKDGLSPLANDEYEGELVTPVSPGVFDYCGRVSVDGGLSWTYCDAGGVTCVGDGSLDGYQSANAGVLTVR